MQQRLISGDLDILALTETWITPEHAESSLRAVCPDGYDGVQCYRSTRGGGVAIVYRSSFRIGPPPVSFTSSYFEHITRSLYVNSVCIRLCVIYRPPKLSISEFLTEFSNYLELLSVSSGKLLIVGDFNIHVDDANCPHASKFLSILESFSLTQHVDFYTRAPPGRPAHILDLVLSRSSDDFVKSCSSAGLFSDQFSVLSCVRAHSPVRPQRNVSFRKLRSIDPNQFRSDLLSLPFCVSPSDDLNSLLHQYNSGLAEILDKHAPLVQRKVTIRPDDPWDCEEIRSARRHARRLERRYRKSGLAIDGELMERARDELGCLIDSKKASFLQDQITEATGKKSLFKIVDSFLIKKPTLRLPAHDSLPVLLDQFGQHFDKKVSDIRACLDAAAVAGSSSIPPDPPKSPPPPKPPPPPPEPSLSQFSEFVPLTVSEVRSLIMSSPTKSSPRDPIPTFILKKFSDVLAPSITKLVNMSLALGVFPDEMKLALVTPLLKKPTLSPEELDNYRPVSNLSFLSKLIERAVVKQLVSHLCDFNLFVPVQSAYRAHHSTETALIRVMNDLLVAVDEGDAVILTLLDQSAAFDTIDHLVLLERLKVRFGVDGAALRWFESYLSDRRQSVSVSGVCSEPVYLRFGVPQGSVLGPILYILYNSPLYGIALLYDIMSHFYADDTQFYKRFKLVVDGAAQRKAFSVLSSCVGASKDWMTANKQKLNDGKTDVLLVHSKTSSLKPVNLPLLVGSVAVKPSTTVKNLGVLFDQHLTMAEQIGATCKKAFYHLHRISRIKKHLSSSAVAQLVHAFVTSTLDYNNSLLFGLPDTQISRLQRLQNCAARLVVGSTRYESITPHLKRLHWLPIRKRIDFKVATLTFRCLQETAPSYLTELVTRYRPARSLRATDSRSLDLVVPLANTVRYGDRAFQNAAPRLWNSLPPSVKSSSSLSQFRSRLKTELFKNAFNV